MRLIIHHSLTCCCLLLAITIGCRKSDQTDDANATANATEQPAARPAAPSTPTNAYDEPAYEQQARPEAADRAAMLPGKTLELDGLSMIVPEGWKPQEIQPGPFAAIAAFALPRAEGDDADGSVRITHYPNMKGMDDMNIDRWVTQVTRDDGTRYTREQARYAVREMGNIRLTMLDMTGNVQATMAESPQPNSRMIAAIVDHPRGPHFVIVAGKVNTMNQWEGSISAFLRSATAK